MTSTSSRIRAYLVHHVDFPKLVNVVWSRDRGKAKIAAANAVRDAFNCDMRTALVALRMRRAPYYDHLGATYGLGRLYGRDVVDLTEKEMSDEP